jgi:hypothetical protein
MDVSSLFCPRYVRDSRKASKSRVHRFASGDAGVAAPRWTIRRQQEIIASST